MHRVTAERNRPHLRTQYRNCLRSDSLKPHARFPHVDSHSARSADSHTRDTRPKNRIRHARRYHRTVNHESQCTPALSSLHLCEYASFSTGRNLSSSSPRSADARHDARPSSAPPHSAMAPCPGAVPSTLPCRRPPSALCRARALLGGGDGGRRRHVDGASHVPHAYRVVPRTAQHERAPVDGAARHGVHVA